MTEDDLTPEERGWMERVPPEVEPPSQLREAVVHRLRSAGVLRSSGPRAFPSGLTVGRMAAGLVLAFLAGGLLGWWGGALGAPSVDSRLAQPEATATEEARFLLLLYEGPEYRALGSTPAELVREYAAWAGRLEDARSLVLADKLSDDARVVEPSGRLGGPLSVGSPLVSGDLGVITGLFVVRAPSYEEAERLAAESPHVAHGGRIIIRRIDET